jgi:hypothetical protein
MVMPRHAPHGPRQDPDAARWSRGLALFRGISFAGWTVLTFRRHELALFDAHDKSRLSQKMQ